VAAHRRVVVLGISVAQDLTSGDVSSLVGQSVQLNGQAFTVVGILAARAIPANRTSTTGRSLRLSAVQDALYGYSPAGLGELTAIAVLAAPGRTGPAQLEVMNVMNGMHHVSAVNTDVVVFNARLDPERLE